MLDDDTLEGIVKAQQDAAEKHLTAAESALNHLGFQSVATRILEGLPGPELVDTVSMEGCDVIVMATHGRSGLSRTFLGSVAEHVVRHVQGVPVLLIHPRPIED